jgi:hypothetical protein
MTRVIVLAVIAAVALLGTACPGPTGDSVFPMTVGNVWNMSCYMLYGTAQPLDTWATGTITMTALAKANLSNGREVVKFKQDATVHYTHPDSTVIDTQYKYMAEVGDSLKSYTSLNDTIGMIVMMLNPAANQTWQDSGATGTVIGQEDVTVAAGTYKGAWKVQVGTGNQVIYQWFARGTGMVKQYGDNTNLGYEIVYDEELTSATIK